MREIGLRAEILINILFLTAVAMLLLGIIAFIVTGRSALGGKINSVKSSITAFGSIYSDESNAKKGIEFLKDVLGPGSWGLIAEKNGSRISFNSGPRNGFVVPTDPRILEVMKTGETIIDVDGVNMPPFSYYRGFKIISPIKYERTQRGVILLYQPLSSLEKEIIHGQLLISASILMNLLIIGLYGLYTLSRRVVTPVQKLIETTDYISRGDFPDDLDLGGVKEINQLHSALKRMYNEIENTKKSLKHNIQALEESNVELIKTQRELIASEKLASLGSLSAGIAHEIGNPLSAIRGYVEVLKRGYLNDEEKSVEFLDNIQKELQRIDRIIRTLIDYSRHREFELKKIDINDVVRHSVEIIKSQGLLRKIEIRLGLFDKPLITRADYHQLSQVLVNLILNSKDAINGDGIIEISTSENQDGQIQLSLKDNGCGIPQEIIDKIFDPFFTTKEPGMGTGLGLSVSQRILQGFDARISAESKPGSGTTFTIVFPNSGG